MHAMRAGFLAVAAAGALACSDKSQNPAAPAYQGLLAPAAGAVHQPGPRIGFGFNGNASGFPTGAVTLTGGGSFNAASASNVVPDNTTDVHSGGGFSCAEPVAQGPLAGCEKDQGVRWDTAQLLASTQFKCSAGDALKPAATGDSTVVLLADFYRAGDGNDESFRAQMIVSETDLAPLIPGDQHLWVQGVGCGTAVVNFSK